MIGEDAEEAGLRSARRHPIEHLEIARGHPCAVAELGDPPPAALDQPRLEARFLRQAFDRLDQLLGTPRVDEQGSVADDLGQRRRPARNHRPAGGHRLEHRQAEALVERWEDQRPAAGDQGAQCLIVDVAKESHPLPEVHASRRAAQEGGLRVVGAGEHQVRRLDPSPAEQGVGGEQHAVVLVWPEVGRIEQIAPRVRAGPRQARRRQAELCQRVRWCRVGSAVQPLRAAVRARGESSSPAPLRPRWPRAGCGARSRKW